MAAEDNLSKKLFHGTKVLLKEGDVILPAKNLGTESNWGLGTHNRAFATEHLKAAKYFADTSSDPQVKAHNQAFATHLEEKRPISEFNLPEPKEVNRVYEVEPIGKTKKKNLSKSKKQPIVEHSSLKGFKVKKQVWEQEVPKRSYGKPIESLPRPRGLQ